MKKIISIILAVIIMSLTVTAETIWSDGKSFINYDKVGQSYIDREDTAEWIALNLIQGFPEKPLYITRKYRNQYEPYSVVTKSMEKDDFIVIYIFDDTEEGVELHFRKDTLK